jgi:predicted ATP-binding protein involved in virulence
LPYAQGMGIGGDWHIDELELKNFRGFEELKLDLHPSLTVLVGVNGTGKTAILDSIAIMLSTVLREFNGHVRGFLLSDARVVPLDLDSQSSVARMESVFPVSARISGTVASEEVWWLRNRNSARGKTTWADRNTNVGHVAKRVWTESDESRPDAPLLPVIALYGVERLLGVRRAAGSIARSRSGAYDAALDGKSDLSRLSEYIKALTLAEFVADRRGDSAAAASHQLEAITLATNRILDGTEWSNPEWSPLVQELTLHHEHRGTLPLSSLSSGIKIAVGLVVDLVSRLARANPGMGAATLLDSAPGIVLIDEVDLHLHPTWQQKILPQLRSIFPRIQFIVTTHSPQVLSTVDAESIRVIDGASVRRVDFSAGLRSDIVMEKILGTPAEPNLAINASLDRYMALVEEKAGLTQEAKGLRGRLDDELGGIANVPKLADADAEIAFYDLED